jgi:beta-1,4-mannosyl-glycoprotein beta-1,4-N-acetylglucosaminyltransferase
VIWSLSPFFNELDVLEIRLAELSPIIDRFVFSESHLNYSGDEKPLHLTQALVDTDRFDRWADKVQVVVADVPAGKDGKIGSMFNAHDGKAWQRENQQRDALIRGCKGMHDDDLVLISDADEIPSAECVEEADFYLNTGEIQRMHLPQHVMYLDWRWKEPTTIAICRFTDGATVKRLGVQGVREREWGRIGHDLKGWHFSYMGGPQAIRTKILSAAHTELQRHEYTDLTKIVHRLEAGQDMFDRRRPLRRVDIEDLPRHVQENQPWFDHMLARRDP